jgi:hypothetical protein
MLRTILGLVQLHELPLQLAHCRGAAAAIAILLLLWEDSGRGLATFGALLHACIGWCVDWDVCEHDLHEVSSRAGCLSWVGIPQRCFLPVRLCELVHVTVTAACELATGPT